ncbi:hypothetical protein XENTR_v10008202 [Xenopus tropicalis]|nr:hypothetical protein XENTR_v10008202 [Xenopus tropicalis]
MQILCVLLCTFFCASTMCLTQTMKEIEEFEKDFYPFLSAPKNDSLATIMLMKSSKSVVVCQCARAQLKLTREYLKETGDPSSTQVKKMLATLDALIRKTISDPLKEDKCEFNGWVPWKTKKLFKSFFKRYNEDDCSQESNK